MIKSLKNEKWKTVKLDSGDFRFKYAVSDRGRLASFKTNVMEGTLLRGTLMGGYPTLKLKPAGENLTLFIHRLVAEAFIANRSSKKVYVIHLNYNKVDNAVKNLRWATKEEMEAHQQKSPAVLAYRSINRKKGHKLTEGVVRKIKEMINSKNRKKTMREIAEHFEISEMQLYRIKSGENWGHVK